MFSCVPSLSSQLLATFFCSFLAVLFSLLSRSRYISVILLMDLFTRFLRVWSEEEERAQVSLH